MKLENDFLTVEIAEDGAEVTRIFDRRSGTEVLWEADPKYWKRHSPVLFPNVGKTWRNTVLIDGTQYPTSQHGFARDNKFTCVQSSETAASFLLHASEETMEVYPFEFELYIHYLLSGKELEVTWQVKNRGEGSMYFTIGGHPAFRCAKPEEKKTEYLLKFPGKEKLTYILLDPESGTGIPEQTYELLLKDEMCPVTEEMFAKDAMVFDGGQIEEAWLCHGDGSPYVGVRSEGFPNYGIWSVKDAPFVCLEPWAGRCDNRGFDKDISEKPGINCLEAGGQFKKSYTIIVA